MCSNKWTLSQLDYQRAVTVETNNRIKSKKAMQYFTLYLYNTDKIIPYKTALKFEFHGRIGHGELTRRLLGLFII